LIFYLPLLLRNCNVESSIINGVVPLSQIIFGFGRPSYEQSNSTSVPAFRSIRAANGRLFLNSNNTGSIENKNLSRKIFRNIIYYRH
jgi:hypothetical protein